MRSPIVGITLGLWFMAAPFVWGYPFGFLWWNSIVIGAAILAIAISFRLGANRISGWVLILVGAYSMFSPFLHQYLSTAAALWNDLVIGVVVVATGVAMAGAGLEYGSDSSSAVGV